jgi:hypothetical protein
VLMRACSSSGFLTDLHLAQKPVRGRDGRWSEALWPSTIAVEGHSFPTGHGMRRPIPR